MLEWSCFRVIVQFCTHFFNLYNRDGLKQTQFVRQARQLYQLIPDPQGQGRDYDFVESSLIYVNRVEQAIRLSVLVAPAILLSSKEEGEKCGCLLGSSMNEPGTAFVNPYAGFRKSDVGMKERTAGWNQPVRAVYSVLRKRNVRTKSGLTNHHQWWWELKYLYDLLSDDCVRWLSQSVPSLTLISSLTTAPRQPKPARRRLHEKDQKDDISFRRQVRMHQGKHFESSSL